MAEITQIRACRACLKTKVEDLENIFSNNLVEKFQFCFDIKVKEVKFAPNFLCKKCVHVIKQFAKFKQRCLKSDAFWKECEPLLKLEKCNPLTNSQNDEVVNDNFKSDNDSVDYTDNLPINNNIELKIENESNNQEQFDDVTSDNNQNTEKNNMFNFQKRRSPNFLSVNGKRILRKFAGQCQGCNKVFSYKRSLISHLQRCGTNEKIVKLKKNSNVAIINNEDIKQYEAAPGIKYCGLCEMTTTHESELFAHLKEHEKADTLACSQCLFKAIDLADFMAHRLKHQPEQWKNHIHKCHKNCKTRYRTMANYEFHYRKIHLKKSPGLCKLCDRVYTNLKAWKAHLNTHTQPPQFECDTCARKFYKKDHFIQHVKTHDSKKEAVCDFCGFATKRRSYLKTHIQFTHAANTQVACKICGKIYRNEFGIVSHMLMAHKEKKFPCGVCEKRFPSPSTLKDHEIWHSEHRPHRCPHCSKSFKNKSSLVQHIGTHNTVKSFMCDVCFKCFNTNKLLSLHRRRNGHLKIKQDSDASDSHGGGVGCQT